MKHIPLDIYDDMPKDMKRYISNYGWHFNKKACNYAVSLMKKQNTKTNKKEKINPYTKDDIDNLLKNYNIELENNIMYDYVYVANMCKADYLGSCIEDEYHVILYIKDTIDDVDASDETTFRRWVATMVGNGIPIDWSEIY